MNEAEETGRSLYPNPVTNNQIFIRFGQELRVNTQLFDSSGRLVLKLDVTRNSIKEPYFITLDPLPSGLYFIQLMDGKEIAYQKLIKQ